MTDWIKRELQGFAEAEAAEDSRENRRKLIANQAPRLWGDLKWAIKNGTDQLNQTPELRKRTGELKCQDAYADKIEVNKTTLPFAIYLTVIYRGSEFSIERKIARDVNSSGNIERRETLYIDLDGDDHVFMRNKDGTELTVDGAVHYLFAPFLHPELLGIK